MPSVNPIDDDSKIVSTRRVNAAAKLLTQPETVMRIMDRLDESELTNLSASISQIQSQRAVNRGDLDEIIAQAFEDGFGNDNLAHLPWIQSNVLVCPGGLVWASRQSHNCRFVSINDTWVWDCHELIREDKRSITGKRDGFRAVALVPVTEGLEIDAVIGKARAGQHSVDRVISYEIRKGELVEVSQRVIQRSH